MAENAKWLDSIEGKTYQFTNALETMWSNMLNSEIVKGFIDFGTNAIKFLDTGAGKVVALTAALTALNKFKFKDKGVDILFGINNIDTEIDLFKSWGKKSENAAPIPDKAVMNDYKDVADDVIAKNQQIGTSAQQAGERGAKGMGAFKAGAISATKAVAGMLKSMMVMYAITTTISLITDAISDLTEKARENSNQAEVLHEKYSEAAEELSKVNSELEALEDELDTTNEQIEALMSQGTLSFVEQEELNRLKEVSAELERQISMTKTLQDSLKTGTTSAAYNASDAFLDTSFMSKESKTERQEKAEEEGKETGKAIGLFAGAALTAAAIALTVATGGMAAPTIGAALTTVGAGAGLGAVSGSAIGGWAGSSSEGAKYDQEQTVREAIADMNATRDELIKARDEAYEAYAANPGNDDLKESYEDAVSDLTTYDETMANRMSTLQQYYNSIVSNWDEASTDAQEKAREIGDMLSAYSINMGTKGAKQSAIDRIFGTEADEKIKSVKVELEKMAKSGDEINLEKAFLGDTEAYNDFVKRLHDQGIYIYECEDAFIELAAAEAAAAEVSFSDIATDINGVTEAIAGAKDALAEFMNAGYSSSSVMEDIKEAFGVTDSSSEELQDMYNEYVRVMLSGNSSIAEAKEATANLAQQYLSEKILGGDFTADEKDMYVSNLKNLGISNAEDFVNKQMQVAGLQQVENILKEHPSATAANAEIQEAAKLYGLEADAVNELCNNLREKRNLENAKTTADADYTAYTEFFEGNASENKKGFKALAEDYEHNVAQYLDEVYTINKRYYEEFAGEEVTAFNPEEWLSSTDGRYYSEAQDRYLDSPDYEYLRRRYEAYQAELEALGYSTEEYEKKLQEGIDKGYLNEDGSIVKEVEQKYKDNVDAAQQALDNVNSEIEATYTVDYELEFAKPEMINTITGITEALEQYQATLDILNETCFDGQVISEEFYNTLREQIGETTVGVEDFFDAIDTSNGYVVKNAELLKELTAQSGKLEQNNAQLARSQARLRYYEIYKEMAKCVSESGELVGENKKLIVAHAEELKALSSVIKKYSILEQQLLGTTSAYDKFEEAQATDSEFDYLGKTENMLTSLIEAYQTGDLGTETAQVAIDALVPPEVLEGAKTAQERMRAVKKYVDETLALYYDIQYDEEGNLTGVQAKFGNARKLIEDGLNKGVFSSASGDYKSFEFDSDFLVEIANTEDKIGLLAQKMGMTKEVAFAWLQELENKDISWIVGNYSSLFDLFTTQSLEDKINGTVQSMANLHTQLAEGSITVDDYVKGMYGLEGLKNQGKITSEEYEIQKAELDRQLSAGEINETTYNRAVQGEVAVQAQLAEEATTSALAWSEKTKQLDEYTSELDALYGTLKSNRDADGNIIDQTIEDETVAKIKETETAVTNLSDELSKLKEPTVLELTFAKDKIQQDLGTFIQEMSEEDYKIAVQIASELDLGTLEQDADGNWIIDSKMYTELDKETKAKVDQYLLYLKQGHNIDLLLGDETKTVEQTLSDVATTLNDIAKVLQTGFTFTLSEDGTLGYIKATIDAIPEEVTTTHTVNQVVNSALNTSPGNANSFTTRYNAMYADGTAHASGTAYSSGNWGTDKTEEALVGELGTEILVDPKTGTWRTIGENGAEFINVPRGSIIFNHKQSEEILKNGHVASRGKAYASGTAYAAGVQGYSGADVILFPDGVSKSQWDGTGYDGPDGEWNLEEALKNIDSAGESSKNFADTIDWVEIRLEELDEDLGLLNAELENAVGYQDKNKIIDDIIGKNNEKRENLTAGAQEYTNEANKYLQQIPAELRDFAKDGTIAIEDFTDTADEATVEAITKYRDYIQKAADCTREEKELIAENRKLAKEAFDNIAEYYDNKIQQEEATKEPIAAETGKGFIDTNANNQLIDINKGLIADHYNAIDELQAEIDSGDLVGDDLNDAINKINEHKSSIISLQQENDDLAKSSFDSIANYYDNQASSYTNAKDQLQSYNDLLETDTGFASEDIYAGIMKENNALINNRVNAIKELQDQLDSGQIEYGTDDWYDAVNTIEQLRGEVTELRTENENLQDDINQLHWDKFDLLMQKYQGVSKEAENLMSILETKDAVDEFGNWTDEGYASLGLLAQQMEAAEVQAKAYQDEINYLNENWQELGYTEEEYLDKLDELQDGQYDSIQSYNDSKDAIVELNKTRVEAIKKGIEKEIDAYDELISKKKEALQADKDQHDYAKTVADQQKNIADIRRKLSALEGDNSASAMAQKRRLQAELAEAEADLEETYYDHSIDMQQNALDSSLESFTKDKEDEIQGHEDYLENTEAVVADSIGAVQGNTQSVLDVLQSMQEEYGLTISDTLKQPWEDGADAIDTYGDKLDTTLPGFAEKVGLTVDEMAAQLGLTLPELLNKLDMTTGDLTSSLDMTIGEFADKLGLSTTELADTFGLTAEELATKLGVSYDDMSNQFGTSMSTTIEELTSLKEEFDKTLQNISNQGNIYALTNSSDAKNASSNKNNKNNNSGNKGNNNSNKNSGNNKGSGNSNSGNSNKNNNKAITVGGKINAKGAKIYTYSGSKEGYAQYFASDPNYVVLKEENGYVLVRHHSLSSGYTGWFKKSDVKAYAKGTKSAPKSGIVNIDELGEELIIGAQNGRLTYLEKGSGVIPADITSNLMSWGELNPQEMLDRNRPTITPSKSIVNTEISIDASVGTLLHVDHLDGNNPDEVLKLVDKAWDKKMQGLNNAMKKFVR